MCVLIALKVMVDVPERLRRHPDLYPLHGESPATPTARIERLHDRGLRERFITYTRSDSSPWRLSLSKICQRRSALEIACNPNDCVERRWGATPATPEFGTFSRQAPSDQRTGVEGYRPWLAKRAVRPDNEGRSC